MFFSRKKLCYTQDVKLDKYQQKAVLTDAEAVLVLAPAGSGKTATLLSKVNYLIEHDHLDPSQILLIAFTRKVVAELSARITYRDVTIRTFHSLGNQIIKSHTTGNAILDDTDMATLVHRLTEKMKDTNPDYLDAFNHYLATGGLAAAATSFIWSHHKNDDADLELLFLAILNLQKSKNFSLIELKSRLSDIHDAQERKNAECLFRLYAPIYRLYSSYLAKHRFYDFADMLVFATKIVRKLPPGSFPYKHILVDEAQDLSDSKCELLDAVLQKCEGAKLFAVGDDWQSIYRFAGSNLDVLDNFEEKFHLKATRTMIKSTYRFGQPTARISNRFIEKNPRQTHKHVKPARGRHTPIVVRLNENFEIKRSKDAMMGDGDDRLSGWIPPDYETINRELISLYHKYGDALFQKQLQIISRYNRDVSRVVDIKTNTYKQASFNPERSTFIWALPGATSPLLIPFCTMHKSKGITRDIVFVINLNNTSLGMPATRPDNPLMATMMTAPDAYPHAEERRLFYVAITRARERTILISDRHHISDFVFEISPKLKGAGVKVCRHCHRGIYELHHSRQSGRTYYSCSHCHKMI